MARVMILMTKDGMAELQAKEEKRWKDDLSKLDGFLQEVHG